MIFVKKFLRWITLPWWIFLLPRRRGMHVYFGPPTAQRGGPDLKVTKLKKRFGNSWWPSILYVMSGKPLPIAFLRLAKKKGLRIFLNQNGVYYPAWYPMGFEQKNKALSELHEVSEHILYQSQFCFDATSQWVHPAKQLHSIVYNAVDCRQFRPIPSRSPKPFRILAATYFSPSKHYVLDHLAKLSKYFSDHHLPYELLVAGQIHDVSKVLGTDKLHYLGGYSQEEAPAIYQQADAFLHLVCMDSCPTAVLEAMACGLPVIYSTSGGTPELVGEAGIGLPVHASFETFDIPLIEDIAAGARQIQENQDRLSALARERAETLFDTTLWFKKHVELFEHVRAVSSS